MSTDNNNTRSSEASLSKFAARWPPEFPQRTVIPRTQLNTQRSKRRHSTSTGLQEHLLSTETHSAYSACNVPRSTSNRHVMSTEAPSGDSRKSQIVTEQPPLVSPPLAVAGATVTPIDNRLQMQTTACGCCSEGPDSNASSCGEQCFKCTGLDDPEKCFEPTARDRQWRYGTCCGLLTCCWNTACYCGHERC
jgi:hypothetical protein